MHRQKIAAFLSIGSLDGKSWTYNDKNAGYSGVKGIKLGGGVAGKSKASFKAANSNNTMPLGTVSALSTATSVTVQLRGSSPALCLSATMSEITRKTGVIQSRK